MPDLAPAHAVDTNAIGKEILSAVSETIPELITLPAISNFVAEKAGQFAREKAAALVATTPEKHAEHTKNLEHLVAQVKGEAIALAIRENHATREKIGVALQAAGKMLLKIVPTLLGR